MHGAAVHRKLRFGPFELSIGERILQRDGQVLPLGARALDILIYLADRPGEVIAKQELIDHVWSDVTVAEGAYESTSPRSARALGDGQFGNRYIANIKARGYSFVAPSSLSPAVRRAGTIVPPPRQALRATAHDDWARNDGRRGLATSFEMSGS